MLAGRLANLGNGNRRHGESHRNRTPEYTAWKRIQSVCTNPNNPKYDRYGGRGIEVHFTTFEEFLACIGRRPSPAHSVDRINNDGHYEAGNLRWATNREQANNRGARRFNRKDYGELKAKYDNALSRIAELEALLAG